MDITKWREAKDIFFKVLDEPEDQRPEFLKQACGEDFTLQGEVEALLAAHFESESFIEKPAFEVFDFLNNGGDLDSSGKHFGHYKVIREIGVGGMGAVFLAERADGEFDQQVAVKVIRQALADSQVIERFKRERQILASLHHPNIARLVDGGVSENGLPFLAMEYVEGEPITEFAEKNNLNIEERLSLFLKICAGVAFAHRNLIVHRDLKPSNIFVTPDGDPVLLDFGLAKLLSDNLDANSNETVTALRAMTPTYASPEQLRGEKITTASDIFSLGIVLYELLTGERPFHFKNQSLNEAIHVVCETNPTRPSDVITRKFKDKNTGGGTLGDGETNNNLDFQNISSSTRFPFSPSLLKGDLDNIILMALSKELDRRYPTVDKFAEDIERHLQGLPVKARSATLSYRAEKFIKRNFGGVVAGLLILLSMLAGLTATVWQARRAHSQQARAERRFNEVRKLSHSLMFEIHDSVQNLSGSTPTRQLIVSRALEYLDSLAQEAGDDASLQKELATAYEKIGDIQGNPYLSNLGDTNGALESYRRSLEIRGQLVSAAPQNVEAQRDLASSYDHIGDVLGRTGDRLGAIDAINKSIAIRKQLIGANSGDNQLRQELATSQMKIGEHLHSSGDSNGALENERQALSIFETLAAQDPQNKKAFRAVMVASNKIGYILYTAGDLNGALENYRKGFTIGETLAARNSNDAPSMRDLTICLNNLGRIYLKQKNGEAATEVFGRSVKIAQDLAAADPKNAQARSDAAYGLVRLGAAQILLEKNSESLESQRRAIAINEALLAENPKNLLPSSEIGDSFTFMGETFEKMGDLKAAFENYQKASSVREKTSATDPSDAQYRQSVAESYQKLGRIYAALANLSGTTNTIRTTQLHNARLSYQKSLEIWQDLNARQALSANDAENINVIQNELNKCDGMLAKL